MAKIECEVRYDKVPNDNGELRDGVIVECGQCGHTVESLGTTGRSVRRCFALLREECPKGEENYYVPENPEDIDD